MAVSDRLAARSLAGLLLEAIRYARGLFSHVESSMAAGAASSASVSDASSRVGQSWQFSVPLGVAPFAGNPSSW